MKKDWIELFQREAKGFYDLEISRAENLERKADELHVSKEERNRLYIESIKIRESALKEYERKILGLVS